MAFSRTDEVRQLEPGLNTIFGDEYESHGEEHLALFDVHTSDKAWEEDVLFPGFGEAVVKPEGQGVTYANTEESWIARYNHETVALAFAMTEEAMEDNLYMSLAPKLSKFLARGMASFKQTKAANVANRAFNNSYLGGDGVELLGTHTLANGSTFANEPATAADLSETSLESILVDIAGVTDERGIPAALEGMHLIVPRQLMFTADRILNSPGRVQTPDNDLNAIKNGGYLPKGFSVNHRLTDTDAWFIKTNSPNGLKMFQRVPVQTKFEGDFETGNMRYKARERYIFGWSDWRGLFGSPGA